MYEADAHAQPFSGRQGGRVKRSLSQLCRHALAMRFRGLLRGADPDKLVSWLEDARHSGIHALQQFARTFARGIDAVENAIIEPWSSGQAEGQINRLKTLKRAMFCRAGIELLRARMLPIPQSTSPESDEDPFSGASCVGREGQRRPSFTGLALSL
ncbi:transposase [Methylocystis sp. IM2]|uniref:transposase n=1 Tax=unclassified Methylocystis TaxID=2625913 RepID=UPI004048849D